MSLGNSSLPRAPPPPPVINKQKPSKFQNPDMPKQTAWLATFKRIFKTPNTRYLLLWFTGGILFSLIGKKAIQRREDQLMREEIDNYLKNKQK